MSWDIFVQDLPPDAKSVADIPADFKPAPIGKRSMMIERIKEIVPTVNFSDPSWGLIDGDGWSIEIDIGVQEDCDGFAFHIRGADAAAGVVAAILQHLKLRALDSQTGDIFVPGADAVDSLRKWRAYYDRAKSSDHA